MTTRSDPLLATSPQRNATVHASAGTGKTWLLVTRVLRLLIAGVSPDSIMAVTFTRKAAAEMQTRVSERLQELMSADAADLDALLQQSGMAADPALRERARRLYEQNLFSIYPLRATTFHAFCQELLQRFPLEAGIPPGFEISESTVLLEQTAWDALFAEATQTPDSPLARALEDMIEVCSGLANTRAALLSFLARRSDWWAYTRGHADAALYAGQQLSRLLGSTANGDPLDGFPSREQRRRLQEFAELLGRNTDSDKKQQAVLANTLGDSLTPGELFTRIRPVFLTTGNAPRKRKSSTAQQKRLGEMGERRFLELHAGIAGELLDILEKQARASTLRASAAWYTAGMRLLEHFQRIKREQRLLDFADLEWQACELLNGSDHASWVQYKLDKRIDHLLVDEFQDTNPTQWRLLLPLLEELAAGEAGNTRSVFLVGDKKQSIYRFRRANPALLGTASDWLAERLQAERFPLDKSRRSAQAVIDAVNRVFGEGALNERISDYTSHATFQGALYGHVELLPLVTGVPERPLSVAGTELRNPLLQPREIGEDLRHYREGQLIAARINTLLDSQVLIGPAETARPVHYGDIMILFRQRTHVAAHERALRDAGIPYLGAGRGTLLENIEVRDLEALLNILISPYDNLALAQVLRCPLFAATDEDLMLLATQPGATWFERLAALPAGQSVSLDAAWPLLAGWHALAGQIPVHDLLDRIYHEGAVLNRYEAAFPPALRPRVRANLTRFIELALEIDSGRYPSLPRFLNQLQRLRRFAQEQPDEGAPEEADSHRVRLMTIHAAKGLESPVVFLADTAAIQKNPRAYEALIDWPAEVDRPLHYLLNGKKADQDSIVTKLLEEQSREDLREDANLLYVAMTRARQFLFVSGTGAEAQQDATWYGLITEALADYRGDEGSGPIVHTSAALPQVSTVTAAVPASVIPSPGLSGKISLTPEFVQIAPSHTAGEPPGYTGDPDGLERGILIHHMLECLSGSGGLDPGHLLTTIAGSLNRDPGDTELQECWDEAWRVYTCPQLKTVFAAGDSQQAWNEVAVQYLDGETLVYGIIDRLLLRRDSILIVDYKTHRTASDTNLAVLANRYREQMRLYAKGAARLWPDRPVEACLLFTACRQLVRIDTRDG